MITAILFDLDGVLLESERLKALSYAKAAEELRPDITDVQVLDFFKNVVGMSRKEVAQELLHHYSLENAVHARMPELGVATPWEAFVKIRLKYYDRMLADPQLLLASRYPHNIALLQECKRRGYTLGLATMSYCDQVEVVLDVLGLSDMFQVLIGREEVEHGKPDPEIYLKLARHLATPPGQCLVVEDSITGIQAALAAKMDVMAIPTELTREHVEQSHLLPPDHIVYDTSRELEIFEHIVAAHNHEQELAHQARPGEA